MISFFVSFVVATQLASFAYADVYDHLIEDWKPDHETCLEGCSDWDKIPTLADLNQSFIDKTWYNGSPPNGAGNKCAMPGGSAGEFECDGCTADTVYNSYAGPWCVCKKPAKGFKHLQYCNAPKNIPEQVNLQIADDTSVVASFVTREKTYEKGDIKCFAKFGESATNMKVVSGISHHYEHLSEAEGVNYTLHFIKFGGLTPGKSYFYKVKSLASSWSPTFTFRAINLKSPKFGIYGDMGHSKFNAMGNLLQECASGKIDFIVHMGDHAYNLNGANDARGDAYMNVFSPVLSSCPWLPIIGNHEANDGDHYERYLNMTWGETLGETSSSATSALGELLTKATLFGPGFHAAAPSNTSRYFSVDIGPIHIVGLDLNNLDKEQLKWLDADLKDVDRSKMPWILVSSHFPLYHPSLFSNFNASNSFYRGDGHEKFATSGHDFVAVECNPDGNCEETVGEAQMKDINALLPLLEKYSVNIYIAGHVHDYAATWPMCNGDICKDGSGEPVKTYNNPKGTIHITEGNGGVPGVQGKNDVQQCGSSTTEWCRIHGHGGNHGIISVLSDTLLTYEHVENPTGKVTDVITVKI